MVKKPDAPQSRPMTQIQKFKEAAKQAETDNREETFDAALRRVGKSKASKSKNDAQNGENH